jgi:hypothetical protein
MIRPRIRTLTIAYIVGAGFASVIAGVAVARAQSSVGVTLEPIQYTFRVVDPEKHVAGVEARVPTGGRATIDLMMAVWTPGYYGSRITPRASAI